VGELVKPGDIMAEIQTVRPAGGRARAA